jgi:cytochrome c
MTENRVKRLFLVCMLAMNGPAAAQDSFAGATLFRQRCQTCHTVNPAQKPLLGPNLAGVFGRKAGMTDFRYSDAMKKAGVTWDAVTLNKYLSGPPNVVPGGKMTVSVPDPKQRADIIAFLQQAGN